MQRDCEHLAGKFSDLSENARQQGVRETSGFTESVHLFLDLINSYMDLCERREKTVQRKHQKALTKVQTMVNYKGRMESAGKQVVCCCSCCCIFCVPSMERDVWTLGIRLVVCWIMMSHLQF